GAERATGAFPHAGLLSPDRRHALERGEPARDHHGNAGQPHFGARGPPDRQRFRGIDGEEEAGRVFLMSLSLATPDTDIALWLSQQTDKSLLRFLTCGSVDDGKSTL